MKSYEKTEEPKKQQGQMGFRLVLQLVNLAAQQVNLTAHHAVQFIQNSFNNGVQKVKELACPSSPGTPDDSSSGSCEDCEDRDFDVPSENSGPRKYRNRKPKGVTHVGQSSLSLMSEDEEGPNNDARPRRARFRRTPKSHVSRGRGAKFTTLRVLLLFCCMLSMVDGCEAASNDRPIPRSMLQLYLITVVILYACACIRATRAAARQAAQVECDCNETSKPVYHRPGQKKHSLSSDSTSMPIFLRVTSEPSSKADDDELQNQPPLSDDQPPHTQLLPGSRTVCVLASEAAAASASAIADAPAVMAVSTPIPEKGIHDPHLHSLSKLVVGSMRLSPDLHNISTRSRGIGNLSISRTVSIPCKDSNLQSFNAEADSVPGDDVVNDASVLPSGGGRSQGENQWADKEECVCRPFVDSSASDSEDDDDDYDDIH